MHNGENRGAIWLMLTIATQAFFNSDLSFDNQSATGSGYDEILKLFSKDIAKKKLQLAKTANQQYELQSLNTLEERLGNARALCKRKTAEVAMYLSDEFRKGFFLQLDNLMDVENWEEDDLPITEVSFTTLLRMLILIKPSIRPGLGATSKGNIIAAWTKGKDRLTVECLPNDRVRWVLSRQLNGTSESAAGEMLSTRLLAALAPYNPNNWFFYDTEEK
jgi:hypothetical protein